MWASLEGLGSRSGDLLKGAEQRARAAGMQSVGSDWLELRGKGAIEVRHGALHRSKSARGLSRPAITLEHSSWSHSAQLLVKEQPVLYVPHSPLVRFTLPSITSKKNIDFTAIKPRATERAQQSSSVVSGKVLWCQAAIPSQLLSFSKRPSHQSPTTCQVQSRKLFHFILSPKSLSLLSFPQATALIQGLLVSV